jgi:hypothetical protein
VGKGGGVSSDLPFSYCQVVGRRIGQWSFVIDAWQLQFNDSHDQMTVEKRPMTNDK